MLKGIAPLPRNTKIQFADHRKIERKGVLLGFGDREEWLAPAAADGCGENGERTVASQRRAACRRVGHDDAHVESCDTTTLACKLSKDSHEIARDPR